MKKRREDEKSDKEIVLRKIPVMLTKDWGGIKTIGLPLSCLVPPIISLAVGVVALPTATSAYMSTPLMKRTTKKTIKITQDDLVIDILGLQRHQGGFFIDDNVAKILNTTVNELKDISKQIITKNTTDKFILLSTAIVLAILESKYSQKEVYVGITCTKEQEMA